MGLAMKISGEPMSVEEYLQYEADGRIRHEYIAGEIYAMSGASIPHNLIAGNVFQAISLHLKGGPCQVFISDVKVYMKHGKDEIFYYPDVVVACERQGIEKHYLTDPKLVVEVLSPSTENTDRREKFIHYRRIPTVEEYILIAQNRAEVTIYRREENWRPVVLTSQEDIAEFHSIQLSMSLADVYASVPVLSS